MKQEFITITEKETAARVQAGAVHAVRVKDITKKGVRVYRHGKIGLAGAVGSVDDAKLVNEAEENLSAGIEYPYALSGDLKDHRSYNDEPMSSEELLEQAEDILAVLRRDYPDFGFSELISTTELAYEMRNSEGLDLKYEDAFFVVSLILKEKASANLFDGFLAHVSRKFDPNRFWKFNRALLEAYRTKVDLPAGERLPVFSFETNEILYFLSQALNGERFAKGASLFSGKMGQQLFSKKVGLEQNRDPQNRPGPFFDSEGVVLKNNRIALVAEGKLKRVLTDKKTAQTYNLEHTGAARGAYDDPPSIDGAGSHALRFKTDSKDLTAALAGSPAIISVVSSGGDFTADGSYAAPVQVAFLFDGERLLGKLPEFTVSSHLDKMLGADYIGTFDNTVFDLGDIPTQLQGYYMTVKR